MDTNKAFCIVYILCPFPHTHNWSHSCYCTRVKHLYQRVSILYVYRDGVTTESPGHEERIVISVHVRIQDAFWGKHEWI